MEQGFIARSPITLGVPRDLLQRNEERNSWTLVMFHPVKSEYTAKTFALREEATRYYDLVTTGGHVVQCARKLNHGDWTPARVDEWRRRLNLTL